jgi:hypothetical protein
MHAVVLQSTAAPPQSTQAAVVCVVSLFHAGVAFIPVLVLPDRTTVLQDTHATISHLEKRSLSSSSSSSSSRSQQTYPMLGPLLPSCPKAAAASQLLELYGDEWLVLPAMHYRWSFPQQRQRLLYQFGRFVGRVSVCLLCFEGFRLHSLSCAQHAMRVMCTWRRTPADCAACFPALLTLHSTNTPTGSYEQQMAAGAKVAARFAGMLPGLGITADSIPVIEARFHWQLAVLQVGRVH